MRELAARAMAGRAEHVGRWLAISSRLTELRRDSGLALVGLAKNTGKTETLTALLRELAQQDRRVGVTSVGATARSTT